MLMCQLKRDKIVTEIILNRKALKLKKFMKIVR